MVSLRILLKRKMSASTRPSDIFWIFTSIVARCAFRMDPKIVLMIS